MKLKARMRLVLLTLVVLLLVIPGTVLALVPAAPPEPAYLEDVDVMVVDGDVTDWSDWNTDPTDDGFDFFADMHRAGDPLKELESHAYLRYDCAQGIMYVLVYTAGDWPVLADRASAWVAIDTISNKVVRADTVSFAWVEQGYDEDDTHAKGWEASFSIAQGTYKILVHTNVYDDGASQTSSTVPMNEGVDLTLDCYTPTAITLAAFTAAPTSSGIQLAWETATEVDTLGFNLYRADSPFGARTLLNDALIASQAPGMVQGATYSFEDASVAAGVTYYYWLEDVDAYGAASLHGPVSAELATVRRLMPARTRPVVLTSILQAR